MTTPTPTSIQQQSEHCTTCGRSVWFGKLGTTVLAVDSRPAGSLPGGVLEPSEERDLVVLIDEVCSPAMIPRVRMAEGLRDQDKLAFEVHRCADAFGGKAGA